MASIVVAVVVADKYKGDSVLPEPVQSVGNVHGAAAETSVDAVELNRQVDAGVTRKARKTPAVVGDVVNGQRSGDEDARHGGWR